MPMKRGTSKRILNENFHEFRHGKTFKRTAARHGAEKVRKQMIAAVLSNKRKSEAKRKAKTRKSSR
jgi:hypothetical protein